MEKSYNNHNDHIGRSAIKFWLFFKKLRWALSRQCQLTQLSSVGAVPYSSKIIKAGALIGDTKRLLSRWDADASVDENIHRMQRDNVFG